ncbi:MAG TPA: carbon starvation protein A [Thermotogota bacterium]|nr:carbon starvation protein A [Thermotogota bacterium]
MNSLVLLLLVFVGYIVAYNTYGRWLAHKIFGLRKDTRTPAHEFADRVDFVPTSRRILFGHHFTSIAGSGPIVGPALAVIWGWLPATLWVVFGSIFMGALQDFAVLLISARNKGASVGELTRKFLNPHLGRAFHLLIQAYLWTLLAVFTMIMAILFNLYPQAVLPIWLEIPIALFLAYQVHTKKRSARVWALVSIGLMFLSIWLGQLFPIAIFSTAGSQVISWAWILFVYLFFASITPVHWLLQPRDFINSHELLILMAFLVGGILFSQPQIVAPAIQKVSDAPDLFPLLFLTLSCGAISGFHSTVSTGTTVRQLNRETDSLFIGYGSMLLEGFLAILVIIAVSAGLGMNGTGVQAFNQHYASWSAASGLSAKLAAVVEGSANLLGPIGIPRSFAVSLISVFIVSFVGTSLDTATRVQRFSLQELLRKSDGKVIRPFNNRAFSTALVLAAAGVLVFQKPDGSGALLLWPIFGALNQLVASSSLLLVSLYLLKRKKPVWIAAIPMAFMYVITIWAILLDWKKFLETGNAFYLLVLSGMLALALWMILGSAFQIRKNAQLQRQSP